APHTIRFSNCPPGGGLVGLLDPTLLRNVTFLTGGHRGWYINRLSSVLQIALREGDRDHVKAIATAGFAGAGVILEGPLGRSTGPTKAEGSWIISVRRTFLDLFTNDIGPGGVPV